MTSGCRETETDSAAAPDDEATTEDEEDGPAEAAEDELAAEGAEGPAEGAVASSTSMMKLFGYPERVLDGSGPRDFGIHKIVPIRKNSVNTEINVVVCSVLCSLHTSCCVDARGSGVDATCRCSQQNLH